MILPCRQTVYAPARMLQVRPAADWAREGVAVVELFVRGVQEQSGVFLKILPMHVQLLSEILPDPA